MGKIRKILMLSVTILMLGISTSCGDKDKDFSDPISASPTQLTMMSDRNSTVTFNITCYGQWTISSDASWLMLSSTSGKGNTTIVATALSYNDSASPRYANLTISSTTEETVVTITQLGAYESNCNVYINNTLALDTSIAFDLILDRNVSYFYYGFLKESQSAGWTDDRIANALMDFDVENANLDWTNVAAGNMEPNTSYLLCAVGFDAKGNRGEVTKLKISTRPSKNSDPWVGIDNIGRDNTYFYWTTVPDGYTQKYYMLAYTGELAQLVAQYFYPANIAYIMRDQIASDDLAVISKGDSWMLPNDGTYELAIGTWGVDANNQFSAQLNLKGWRWNSSSIQAKLNSKLDSRKDNSFISKAIKDRLKENIKVYRVE